MKAPLIGRLIVRSATVAGSWSFDSFSALLISKAGNAPQTAQKMKQKHLPSIDHRILIAPQKVTKVSKLRNHQLYL